MQFKDEFYTDKEEKAVIVLFTSRDKMRFLLFM